MEWIKRIYLYSVSLISLVIIVIGSVMLINLLLQATVFTKTDVGYDYYSNYGCDRSAPTPAEGGVNSTNGCTQEQIDKEMQLEKDRRTGQKQRDASTAISMILVASPVFWYHWRLARKET